MPEVQALTRFDQAQRLIHIFGGQRKLAHAVGVNRLTVRRWTRPPPEGTDGLVPTSQVLAVLQAAHLFGVEIPPDVWVPTPSTLSTRSEAGSVANTSDDQLAFPFPSPSLSFEDIFS